MDEKKKCNRCKNMIDLDEYKIKKDGTYQKICIKCNLKVKKYRLPKVISVDTSKDEEVSVDTSKDEEVFNDEDSSTDSSEEEQEVYVNSRLCVHGKLKWQCIDCGGKNICEHRKIKRFCVECNPDYSCAICKEVGVGSRSKFHPYCFKCYRFINPEIKLPRKYMMKEHHLRDALDEDFDNVKLIYNMTPDDDNSFYIPDVRIDFITHTIIIDCMKEKLTADKINNYRKSKTNLSDKPIVVICFNPDKTKKLQGCFKETKGGFPSLIKKEWHKRIKVLGRLIEKYEKNTRRDVTIECLFLD